MRQQAVTEIGSSVTDVANVSTVSRAERLCNEAAVAVVDGVPGARAALAVAELLLARARSRCAS